MESDNGVFNPKGYVLGGLGLGRRGGAAGGRPAAADQCDRRPAGGREPGGRHHAAGRGGRGRRWSSTSRDRATSGITTARATRWTSSIPRELARCVAAMAVMAYVVADLPDGLPHSAPITESPLSPALRVTRSRNPRRGARVGQGTSSATAPMLLPLLLLLGDTDPAAVYNGRAGRLDVHPPRLEAELTVDGTLDEAAWAAGGDAHRLLPVHPGRRRGRGGLDRGAGLVFRDRHPLRHPGLRGPRPGARHARRPRQDRRGRLRPDPARHVRRRAPGLRVRGESVRRAVRWGAGRDRLHQRQRLQQRRRAAGDRRPASRLRVRLEGPAHRLRLRDRSPDSVQEPPLPAGAGAAVGHQRHPPGAALGRRGLVGAGQAGQRVVPGAVGPPGRPDRAAARAGARVQSVAHLADDRRAGRRPAGSTRAAVPSWAAASGGASPTTSTSTPRPIPTSRRSSRTRASSSSIRGTSSSSPRSGRSSSTASSSSPRPTR